MGVSTLVLGLGGTGVKAVRAVKKLHLREQQKKGDQNAHTEFLAIDLDRSAIHEDSDRLAELDPGEFLYLDPEAVQVPVRNLNRTIDSELAWESVRSWFPDPSKVRIPVSEIEANGAAQYRMLGRLGFFVHDTLIEKALLRAYEQLEIEVDSASATRQRRVILVASVAGGTGSGMMIDLAYLIRRHLVGRPHVYAYLLLPEVFAEVDHGGRIYENAYATLRELAHLKDQLIPFQADYFHLPPLEIPVGGEQPFSRIYLFGRAKGEAASDSEDDRIQPVLAATLQMAKAIQPLLNRQLQEKIKAVAANTVSSESSDKARRLRTQCFSTSGSGIIPVGQDGIIDDDRLFRATLDRLTDKGLHRLLSDETDARIQQLFERLGDDPMDHASPIASEQEALSREEKLVSLADRSLHKDVSTAAEVLVDGLLSEAKDLNEGRASFDSEDIEHAKTLRTSVLALLQPAPSKEAFKRLRSDGVRGSEEAEEIVEAWIQRFIPAAPSSLDLGNRLARWSFLAQLHSTLKTLKDAEAPPSVSDHSKGSALYENLSTVESSMDRDLGEKPWKRWFTRTVPPKEIQKNYAALTLANIASADKEALKPGLKRAVRAAAIERIENRLETALGSMRPTVTLQVAKRLRDNYEDYGDRADPLPDHLARQLEERLGEVLPRWVGKINRLRQDLPTDEDLDERTLQKAFREVIYDGSALEKIRYDEGLEVHQDAIIRNLIQMRQNLFVPRTPNPRRKGIAFAACPSGFSTGQKSIRHFLEVNAEQLLLCRCSVVSTREDQIRLYYEDLFNPPDHLRDIDTYYGQYRRHEHKALFHIDRRFLDNPDFREITTGVRSTSCHCGNPGCTHNLIHAPLEALICDGCHRPIRSRCGNPECPETALHMRQGATDLQCPECGGFNRAAWWKCGRHGKEQVLVPIDKAHCPRCIEKHHEDPVGFPERCVGKRPDLEYRIQCPRCLDLRESDPDRPVFELTGQLAKHYRDGVNGHDTAEFHRLAKQEGLVDGFRCPHCYTHLIPVHHRNSASAECP